MASVFKLRFPTLWAAAPIIVAAQPPPGGGDGTNCMSTIPQDGTAAVKVKFWSNPSGGSQGADCPVACIDGEEVIEQWYSIEEHDPGCKEWPGNSGHNAMMNGVCNVANMSYSYDQWTNCDCSGEIGAHKELFTYKCVVDQPPSLCAMVTDFNACENYMGPMPSPSPMPTPSPMSPPADGPTYCAQDGSDYYYMELVSFGAQRDITTNFCPNHVTHNLNPNVAISGQTTIAVPAKPVYQGPMAQDLASAAVDLSAQGGAVGVFFSGAMLYSPYGGPNYGQTTGWMNSATAAEGNSFDQCGGHSSSTTIASYHYHVPPACLHNQMASLTNWMVGSHSPQLGWAYDGFPIYGPYGLYGTAMKTCTVTGETYGVGICTDDCGGFYGEHPEIDAYIYRYYMQGQVGDGMSCDAPGCPSPTSEFFPNSPMCLRGCCPPGVSCWSNLPACDTMNGSNEVPSSYTNFTPQAHMPLETYMDGCECENIMSPCNGASTCDVEFWNNPPVCMPQAMNMCPGGYSTTHDDGDDGDDGDNNAQCIMLPASAAMAWNAVPCPM